MSATLLTQDEVEFFHATGYLAVGRPLVGDGDLAETMRRLDQLFARYSLLSAAHRHDLGAGDGEHAALPEIVWPSALDGHLGQTKVAKVIRRAAAELLGTDRVIWHFDHAIFKPAMTGAETAWHQDVAFDPDHDCPMATIWFPLVDATIENGCMGFVPNSHVGPIHPHVANGKDGLRLADSLGGGIGEPVMCPIPAGGITVHQARTIHGAGPNTSQITRGAWIVKFIQDDRSRPVRALSEHRKRRQERLARNLV
jgi:Phytanoyl-CoA dioxygenase (PhyH)